MEHTQKIPFVIGSDAGFSQKSNNTSLVNLFLHVEPAGSKDNYIILNSSGLAHIMDFPDDIRGIYSFLSTTPGALYVVTRKNLYLVDTTTQTGTDKGSVTIGWKYPVVFANNGIEMVFVDPGGGAYSYNPTTDTLKDLTTEDGFYLSDGVTFLDGYFIFNRSGTGQFFLSRLLDTTFDPLMFATAESNPDNLLNVLSTSRELWLFGENSIEVWYNSGAADFPFARIPGAISNIGCVQNTPRRLNESIYFVGNDYRVYQTSGHSIAPQISNGGIEKILNDNRDQTINTFTFKEYGHSFYVITIGDIGTYLFDTTTAQWHNRKSGTDDIWAVQGVVGNE